MVDLFLGIDPKGASVRIHAGGRTFERGSMATEGTPAATKMAPARRPSGSTRSFRRTASPAPRALNAIPPQCLSFSAELLRMQPGARGADSGPRDQTQPNQPGPYLECHPEVLDTVKPKRAAGYPPPPMSISSPATPSMIASPPARLRPSWRNSDPASPHRRNGLSGSSPSQGAHSTGS